MAEEATGDQRIPLSRWLVGAAKRPDVRDPSKFAGWIRRPVAGRDRGIGYRRDPAGSLAGTSRPSVAPLLLIAPRHRPRA